jgi:hypothetical protein
LRNRRNCLREVGLFLGVDGTLLDWPRDRKRVVVKPELLVDLQAAERSLGGAFALARDCSIKTLDGLFALLRLCAAGVRV